LQQVLAVIDQASVGKKTATGPIFHELAERFTKRGVVLILSDLFDNVDGMLAGLKHFHHRRHDVIVMHTLDPAELDFPFRGPTMFQGLEEYPEVLADPDALRKAYQREFAAFQNSVKRGCRQHNLDYQELRTDQDLDVTLASYLATRMARVK
jgi:uncharacterized protein (DUF58 family)